jgi:hypothetical protein
MDILRVRIHNKDEDAWSELGTILLWFSRLILAFVFLAPLMGALVALGAFLLRQDMHPVFCIVGSMLAAVAIWYTFHTLRWLIMAYGTLYTAVAAALIFMQLRDTSDPVWASAGAIVIAAFGLALSWSVYKRHTLARGWAF